MINLQCAVYATLGAIISHLLYLALSKAEKSEDPSAKKYENQLIETIEDLRSMSRARIEMFKKSDQIAEYQSRQLSEYKDTNLVQKAQILALKQELKNIAAAQTPKKIR